MLVGIGYGGPKWTIGVCWPLVQLVGGGEGLGCETAVKPTSHIASLQRQLAV